MRVVHRVLLAQVLTTLVIAVACTQGPRGEPQGAASAQVRAEATSPKGQVLAPAPRPSKSPPGRAEKRIRRQKSPIETRVIKSLKAVNVRGGVEEHGYKDAWIGGKWRGNRVVVHAYLPNRPEARLDGEGRGSTTIMGIEVAFKKTSTAFGTVGEFSCEDLVYETSVDQRERSRSSNPERVTSFLREYLPTLGCGP